MLRSSQSRLRWGDAAASVAIALLLLWMQARSGAFHADLAFDPDEPAHAVSSLMVRDYLAQALGRNPMHFAYGFYAHYPKVAIGHWPPLLYVAEALWMLAAGRSRVALLLFLWLCAVALVASVYWVMRRGASPAAAAMAVAVIVHPRSFQEMLTAVHPEMLLALFVFWAMVFCGEWIWTRSRRSGVLFVLFAVAALAVHGRAAVLLLAPFLLLPFCERMPKWTWGLLVLAMALLLIVPHRLGQTDPFQFSEALRMNAAFLVRPWVGLRWWLPLVLAGLVLAFQRRARQRALWLAMVALIVGSYLFLVLVPVHWDDRYLLTPLPAAAVLAGLAVQKLLDWLHAPALRAGAICVAMVTALVAIGFSVRHMTVKPDPGYRQFVRTPLFADRAVVLVDADGLHEGALIVESSLIDPQRRHTILRGSKVLAQTNWVLRNFRLRYGTAGDVLQSLDRAQVGLVVVQEDSGRAEIAQLRAALAGDASRWTPVREGVGLKDVTVYRRRSGAQD